MSPCCRTFTPLPPRHPDVSRRYFNVPRRYTDVSSIWVTACVDFVFVLQDATQQPKKRTFKTFSYRGIALEKLMDMPFDEVVELLPARHRRKFLRGVHKYHLKSFRSKLMKAKKETVYGQKPRTVKTHYRNMTVTPDMIGSVVGVYNGKTYIEVEIKPEMIGHYLGEFAITYKPVKHGKYGATTAKVTNSKFYQVNY